MMIALSVRLGVPADGVVGSSFPPALSILPVLFDYLDLVLNYVSGFFSFLTIREGLNHFTEELLRLRFRFFLNVFNHFNTTVFDSEFSQQMR